MSCRILVGSFDHEEDLLEAIARVREQGWRIIDVYVPYAVHGLDRALGLRPSRLTWVAFVCGALGVALALWLQFWTTAADWPLNVGGRPWNSLPAFVPVTFEMMVLFAGLGIVLAFLLKCRLFPGKKPDPLLPGGHRQPLRPCAAGEGRRLRSGRRPADAPRLSRGRGGGA